MHGASAQDPAESGYREEPLPPPSVPSEEWALSTSRCGWRKRSRQIGRPQDDTKSYAIAAEKERKRRQCMNNLKMPCKLGFTLENAVYDQLWDALQTLILLMRWEEKYSTQKVLSCLLQHKFPVCESHYMEIRASPYSSTTTIHSWIPLEIISR